MIKRVLVVLMGLLPLLLGFVQNRLMMTAFLYTGLPSTLLIGIGVIAAWFFLGMLSAKMLGNKTQALILLNASASLFLTLIFIQEVIVGHFWFNIMGVVPQFFYMPTLGIGMAISSFVPFSNTFIIITGVSFILKLGASSLGIKIYSAHPQEGRR